jgi:hypothetical protein
VRLRSPGRLTGLLANGPNNKKLTMNDANRSAIRVCDSRCRLRQRGARSDDHITRTARADRVTNIEQTGLKDRAYDLSIIGLRIAGTGGGETDSALACKRRSLSCGP